MTLQYRQQGGGGAGGGGGGGGGSSTAASTVASNGASSASAITSGSAGTASASSSAPPIGITGGPGFNPNAINTMSVGANADPGEIVFTQPPPFSTSYYKIAPGEYITFGWNFSYLAYTPSSMTVSAACDNGNTYPVGPSDGVIPGDAQSVVWYPYGYQTANPSLPLAQASYTLLIFAQGGPSAIPTPGFLAPNDQLRFALYTPQAYTPITSGWQCSNCGGALEQFKAHPASIALLTTLLVIFLSGFTTLRRVWD